MAQPLAKFRAGQVTAALWKNDVVVNGKQVSMQKATVERRYKDRDGSWKSSGSFSRTEIPLVIYCLQKCFDRIIQQDNDKTGSNVIEEVVE